MAKMNPGSVNIYEFRRGFAHQLQGESWVSTGFYGPKYVGITFEGEKIPQEIIRAIANEAFQVSQLVSWEEFEKLSLAEKQAIGSLEFNRQFVSGIALVGKTLDTWAVLAVITGAIDFAPRYLTVQRYFCCQKSDDYDAMATLITWWVEKQLIFDIFDNDLGQVYQAYPVIEEQELNNTLLSYSPSAYNNLYLISPELDLSKNNLLSISSTCSQLASQNRSTATWAFNVNQLKRPELFTLVQAGTSEFYQQYIFHQSVVSGNANLSIARANYGQASQEHLFELAPTLSEFITKGKLSSEQIEFFKQELNKDYNSEGWQKLFTDLLNNKVTDEKSMIRLLTIEALIIPKNSVILFQELLRSNNDTWKDFDKIQESLFVLEDELNDKAEKGVWQIINNLIEDKFKLPFWRSLITDILRTKRRLLGNFFCVGKGKSLWITSFEKCLLKWLDERQYDNYIGEFIPSEGKINQGKYLNLVKIIDKSKLPIKNVFNAWIYSQILKKKVPAKLYEDVDRYYGNQYPEFIQTLEKKPTLKDRLDAVDGFFMAPIRFPHIPGLRRSRNSSTRGTEIIPIRRPRRNHRRQFSWLDSLTKISVIIFSFSSVISVVSVLLNGSNYIVVDDILFLIILISGIVLMILCVVQFFKR
ncbi:MAG: hypothetical protein F6K41_06025 [Symploca sp. SIO3E6]|nr:hypothetical protein [Caldora sp. SIO3E6]